MLVYKDDKILLVERKKYPFGFATPAGHVDDKGSYENAAREELEEEVGLKAESLKLIKEGRKDNPCRRKGGSWHYWKIYKVEAGGELKPSKNETKQASWYTKKQIEKLAKRTYQYLTGNVAEDDWQTSPGLEPVWYEWFFRELKVI
jgi:ADP-ribose pyrophosphatase YjhB (NUDIX family)